MSLQFTDTALYIMSVLTMSKVPVRKLSRKSKRYAKTMSKVPVQTLSRKSMRYAKTIMEHNFSKLQEINTSVSPGRCMTKKSRPSKPLKVKKEKESSFMKVKKLEDSDLVFEEGIFSIKLTLRSTILAVMETLKLHLKLKLAQSNDFERFSGMIMEYCSKKYITLIYAKLKRANEEKGVECCISTFQKIIQGMNASLNRMNKIRNGKQCVEDNGRFFFQCFHDSFLESVRKSFTLKRVKIGN